MTQLDPALTHPVADRLVRFALGARVPGPAIETMRLCLFDWTVCAMAGASEPVAGVVRAMASAEGGTAQCSVVGLPSMRVPARAAALSNGATSHALDYDDTHFDHIGHPSVAVLPAVLAMAERHGSSGAAVLEAAMVGAEASVRLGRWLGESHAAAGFHTTSTAGAFGAGLAAARLCGLDARSTGHMIGILASRACGVRAQFGSMGKPLNAGLAAAAGIEAADLAAAGLESQLNALEGEEGFAVSHAGQNDSSAFSGLGAQWAMTRISFKAHACCHGLHAMLNALGDVRLSPSEVDRITVRTHPRWMTVCAIPSPRTGLEAKFSYRLTAAMAVSGWDTAAPDSYSEAACADPALSTLRDKVDVVPDKTLSTTEAVVDISATGGRAHRLSHDLTTPESTDATETRLRRKAVSLLGPSLAETVAATTLCQAVDTTALATLLRSADAT